MLRLSKIPTAYRWLDVAQLVKHAFGVANSFSDRPGTLLYLYWEPTNARDFPIFAEHREEVARLKEAVSGSSPEFAAMSYTQLWQYWLSGNPPAWLLTHVARLKARYEVAA